MTDKHTVNFGDICREVKLTSKDPIADGYEYYIGLEHLDSGALNIKRRGVLSEDNPSFNRVFRKGDILLGKRRPYLRKAAIANFSGVCSNDIVVLSANKNIIKEPLVQYVIHSDAFWQWAVKTSAGGLSPRTKFKDLEKFSFIIPNRLSQEKYHTYVFKV
ncbi:MAG: restriction endonuclease subunit S [Pararheinheimera sp.]|nr:restriction endonuclease subunit S [Rheinheimera sp.]